MIGGPWALVTFHWSLPSASAIACHHTIVNARRVKKAIMLAKYGMVTVARAA